MKANKRNVSDEILIGIIRRFDLTGQGRIGPYEFNETLKLSTISFFKIRTVEGKSDTIATNTSL